MTTKETNPKKKNKRRHLLGPTPHRTKQGGIPFWKAPTRWPILRNPWRSIRKPAASNPNSEQMTRKLWLCASLDMGSICLRKIERTKTTKKNQTSTTRFSPTRRLKKCGNWCCRSGTKIPWFPSRCIYSKTRSSVGPFTPIRTRLFCTPPRGKHVWVCGWPSMMQRWTTAACGCDRSHISNPCEGNSLGIRSTTRKTRTNQSSLFGPIT
mmetsp:Transcript_19490/g.44559  ORF Transcript_19490/g.44559 Transcript_19490/m.44559 type:complete len:209 (-) Transcript_19490:14-640(-)